ncbi:MAG: arginase family protein [Phycisphaerales bacterium]
MGVPQGFDPNAAADAGSGIFGLPHSADEALVRVLPVPYEATTSYGKGTADGPAAVGEASLQLDLNDHLFGDAWRAGVFLDPEPAHVRQLSDATRAICERVFAGGADATGKEKHTIDAAGEKVMETVREWARGVLATDQVPCVLGGDHSTPLGNILACAEAAASAGAGLGVLQFDAHMDLRTAYCGMRFSHASVMHNTLVMAPGVSKLVQVGIRDYSGGELEAMREAGERVATHFGEDLFAARDGGESWGSIAERIVGSLPERVYVSFDIDAYEPHLCPNTGTPVPGGLSFFEARAVLAALVKSGRRIVGFDVVEVSPGGASPINEIVGMRALASVCWAAVRSRGA